MLVVKPATLLLHGFGLGVVIARQLGLFSCGNMKAGGSCIAYQLL